MSAHLAAEIGQNHQGSADIAHELIEAIAHPFEPNQREPLPYSWDSVKFCRRDLDGWELSREAEQRPYEGRQSFGDTYGEHRRELELSWDAYVDLHAHAKELGLGVGITLCAPTLVGELPFRPDYLKTASRDLSNFPLLREMARTQIPMVVSTGMHGPDVLDQAVALIREIHDSRDKLTILHCLSDYPADPEDVNLRSIRWLKDHYPQARIGYSDHTIGLNIGAAALALGATWVEKHVTHNRGAAGSDHEGALGWGGQYRFVRDMREIEAALGEYGMDASEAAEQARRKLERSVASSSDLEPGTVLGSSNTRLLSPGTGVSWPERGELFGKEIAERVPARTVLSSTMVQET